MKPKSAQLSAMAIMVLIMTFVVVFVSTWINFGFDDAFVFRFFRGWGIAFVIAYPLVIVLMPRLQKFFQGFVKKG
jgi:hypothetical protein